MRPSKAGRRGDVYVGLAGSGLAVCLLMLALLVGLVLVQGLGVFWPARVERFTLRDGEVVIGTVVSHEPAEAPSSPGGLQPRRLLVKVANRDLFGADARWIREPDVLARERPPDVLHVERRDDGPLVGLPVTVTRDGRAIAEGAGAVLAALPALVERAARDRADIRRLERSDLGAVNAAIEAAQQAGGGRVATPPDLERRFREVAEALERRRAAAASTVLTVEVADGRHVALPVVEVFRAYAPNRLDPAGRIRVYASRLWEFVTGDPRASNTEGGIFPAIFGTVLMVVLMSVAVVPFGVLTALYLREYARQGWMVRAVRVAVNNLAGVPSIVFGMFGLGFFVYVVGGSLDRWLFAEALPAPTFGTGGILWASLTLALLTVPVVIVAAEEALAAVPRSLREASLAAGATKSQTIVRVVLPSAAPGIMTGLILAMARGAGEVAPLMLTGVVKLAPDLPIDGTWPFLHVERKFMHLGFHIYDAGFQSPDVAAATPTVFATSVLLLAIVAALNLTAILVRNRLRRRHGAAAF